MTNKKIKILFTIRQGKIGGGETYLFNLVSRLNREVFEPEVLSFTEGELIDKLKALGIKTRVFPTIKPFNPIILFRVFRLIQKEQYHLIHMHGTRAATNTLFAGMLAGKKLIYTAHGWSFHTGNSAIITALRKFSERIICKFSSLTVCGSQADASVATTELKAGKVRHIANSIDPEFFTPVLSTGELKQQLGIQKDCTLIASIARLTFQKDPLTFIKAASEAIKQKPELRFLLMGNGEMETEAKSLVKELDLTEKIFFLPFSTNVKSVLKEIDTFVLPSLWEVVPLGLLEAMSMEKPCIAARVPGTTEALIDNKTGLLFTPGNYRELAEKILMLAENKDLGNKLGVNAREMVKNSFNLGKLISENEKLYLSEMQS